MADLRTPMGHVLLELAELLAVRRSPCPGGATGCVLATPDGRILAMGYNGPPHGWNDRLETCKRDELDLHGGMGYEVCPCVHAEANALAHAAKHGVPTAGATAYCNRKPCSACAKSLIQAGVVNVVIWEAVLEGVEFPVMVSIPLSQILQERIDEARASFE